MSIWGADVLDDQPISISGAHFSFQEHNRLIARRDRQVGYKGRDQEFSPQSESVRSTSTGRSRGTHIVRYGLTNICGRLSERPGKLRLGHPSGLFDTGKS